MIKQRTTVYLNSDLVKMLKLRAIKTNQSVSAYLNQVIAKTCRKKSRILRMPIRRSKNRTFLLPKF